MPIMTSHSAIGKRARSGKAGRGPVIAMLVVFVSLAAAPALKAAPDESEMQIVARMLSFLNKPLTGTIRAGIVYEGVDGPSFQEATGLRQLMGSGFKSGNVILKPVMLRLEDVDTANVDLLILADGVGRDLPGLGARMQAKKVPCVTLDIEQVKSGNCAIGIQTSPRIEILVNRAAASRSGVAFAGAFRMLVTEF